MSLSLSVENAIGDFAHRSGFTERGGVIIDLDGTTARDENGGPIISRPVELGLKSLYERGRPVVLSSIRFPLSVMRTFGKEWLAISHSPIPMVAMNGSQVGYVRRDENDELCFEEIVAFPLTGDEIDAVITRVESLLAKGIDDLLLFYYPRDWRLGEMIWTPIAENVAAVKELYQSAASVTAVGLEKLQAQLQRHEVCMLFLQVGRLSDDPSSNEDLKQGGAFTNRGVDKLTGTRAAAEHIGFEMPASLGAGDAPVDVFLNAVGMAVHVGARPLGFRGLHTTIRVANSFELGDVLFRLAGIQDLTNSIDQKRIGQAG